jgi:hypothetical protein
MKNTTNTIALFMTILAVTPACQKASDTPAAVTPVPTPTPVYTPALVFNSGFEGSTQISATTNPQIDQITGIDNTVAAPNDWVTNLQNKSGFGGWRFYYEQGTTTQRFAKIGTDPVNAANKVLQFAITQPHITLSSGEVKARVQVEQYGGTGVKEFYQSTRLFLPADFDKFSNGTVPGSGDWITLFEYWNNAGWLTTVQYPFRISVNLDKAAANATSPLRFEIHGQTFDAATGKYTNVWQGMNTAVTVPTGKWMTVDIYFKEGRGNDGRFYMAITPDGGTKTTVFNVENSTCHPQDSTPDGLTEINPLKLYTSANVITYLNANGGKMQVYWDDYKIWLNKKP